MSKKQESKTELEHIKLLQDQLARALADYDNFRKRTEREKEQLQSILKAQVFARLLPAMDMLMETQKHLNDPPASASAQSLRAGAALGMTVNEFLKAFKEEGIELITVERGIKFDESLHEAVESVEENEMEDGAIVEEVAKGWRLTNGPIIRHAKVKVNKINN